MKTNAFKSILAIAVIGFALVSCKKDAWDMNASNVKNDQSLYNTQSGNTAMIVKKNPSGIIWPDTAKVRTY